MIKKIVKNASAFCFKEIRLGTTGDVDHEHKKYVGQISTILRALTSKYGGFLSHFDKINKNKIKSIRAQQNICLLTIMI